jgi:hypothetical protein
MPWKRQCLKYIHVILELLFIMEKGEENDCMHW